MDFGFLGIGSRLRNQMKVLRLRGAIILLDLLRPVVTKLGSGETNEKFAAQWAAHDQAQGEEWKSVHRRALFTNVGLALSQWAGMEDLLVGIACLLLRTHESAKIGIVLYSIVNFNTWLSIIGELFSQEPLYAPLKPRWNKLSERLRALKDTRDRLAHHTIYDGPRAKTYEGDTALRPGTFDSRTKSQKYQPLDYDQISAFIESVNNVVGDLTALLNSMTEMLQSETLRQKSSSPAPDQSHP
jgi:hypothetical protein